MQAWQAHQPKFSYCDVVMQINCVCNRRRDCARVPSISVLRTALSETTFLRASLERISTDSIGLCVMYKTKSELFLIVEQASSLKVIACTSLGTASTVMNHHDAESECQDLLMEYQIFRSKNKILGTDENSEEKGVVASNYDVTDSQGNGSNWNNHSRCTTSICGECYDNCQLELHWQYTQMELMIT